MRVFVRYRQWLCQGTGGMGVFPFVLSPSQRLCQYAVKVRRHMPWSRGPLSWIPGMLVHALSISFATAQSSHNSEIYNNWCTCAVGTREPGNHDNGTSDVWTLTAYWSEWNFIWLDTFVRDTPSSSPHPPPPHPGFSHDFRIGCPKYTFGVNWVFIPLHHYTKNMDIRLSKISNRVSKRHMDTPLTKGLPPPPHHHHMALPLPHVWNLKPPLNLELLADNLKILSGCRS